MIYFIECDAEGNIWHYQANPQITIVPLVNIASIQSAKDVPVQLTDPIGVSAATYNMIVSGGCENFSYDAVTQTVIPKVKPNVPATTS